MKTALALSRGALWMVFLMVFAAPFCVLIVLDCGGKPEPLHALVARLERWRRRFVRQPSEG